MERTGGERGDQPPAPAAGLHPHYPEAEHALRGVPVGRGGARQSTEPEPLTDAAVLAVLEAFADRAEPRSQALGRLAREMAASATELAHDSAAVISAVRARQSAAADPAALTAHQLHVVQLAALDLDTAQIAAELGVDVATVRSHWREVYRRLGVRTRTGAVGKLIGSTRSVEISPQEGESAR